MRKKIITSAIICVILSLTSTCSNPSPRHIPALSSTPCSLKSAFKDVSSHPLMGHIVFSYDGNIYISRADGSQRTQLTFDPWAQFDPTLSPDGKHIAYRDGRDRHNEIYKMNVDGSNKVNLTHHVSDHWSPAWSPDGRRFAFTSDREGILSVYTMNPDGSDVIRLTTDWGEYPSWSPDSTQIVYASARRHGYDIYTMEADGSQQRQITTHAAYDMSPVWSPEGNYIAYDTQQDYYPPDEEGIGPEFEIHIMTTNGACDTRLTNNRLEDRFSAWSPNGTRLAWTHQGHIIIAHPDGSHPTEGSAYRNVKSVR